MKKYKKKKHCTYNSSAFEGLSVIVKNNFFLCSIEDWIA